MNNSNNSNKGLEALAALASTHRNNNNNNEPNSHGDSRSSAAEGSAAGQIIDYQALVNLTAALQQQHNQQQHNQQQHSQHNQQQHSQHNQNQQQHNQQQHNQQQQQQHGAMNTALINQQLLSQVLNSGMNPAAVATLLQSIHAAGMNSQFDLLQVFGQPATQFGGLPSLQNQALQLLLRSAAGNAVEDTSRATGAQVLPLSSSHPPASNNTGNNNNNNMISLTATTTTTSSMPPPQSTKTSVGSLPLLLSSSSSDSIALQQQDGGIYSDEEPEGKKQMKRAANRKSAQLSRKRKKQFIEELKEENDGLRRKEQILRSIPDLVVVFDSSGKLWFVSESVERFLSFTASELEGTSFWDRLSPESVRILKAAFMDSLAAREGVSDTVQLGTGVWELELVDKTRTHKRVSLNGVVHFAGERPECVCSIRPLDPTTEQTNVGDATRISDSSGSGESESEGGRS